MEKFDLLAEAVNVLYEEIEDSKHMAWKYVREADKYSEKDDETYNRLRHAVCTLITVENKK